eukprot:jgi/Mesvir1/21277/Mv21675-RA.1
MRDNWALLYSVQKAKETSASVSVAFNLDPDYAALGARQAVFCLRGLRKLEEKLAAVNIPLYLYKGKADATIPAAVADLNISLLVTDFSPLRGERALRDAIVDKIDVPFHEVDAHNIVPVWVASDKQEYSARTIRPKIHKHMPEFLDKYPEVPVMEAKKSGAAPKIPWEELIAEALEAGKAVPEVTWCKPGEDAAMIALMGEKSGFLTARIKLYATQRNNPCEPLAVSNLSPWLHFGHISAQRVVMEAKKYRKSHAEAVESFIEELVVRREICDNFCYYCPNYDSVEGAYEWARETLRLHAADKREHLYTREQLEKGQTYDDLWNASQMELLYRGKMHGFMRMYWAKKILEWTESPEVALATAIYLNDKYSIDGKDPNGFVGCMWSVCGIHDQGWAERPIFGKIRYMNYAGCKRKFDIAKYIAYAKGLAKRGTSE